MAAQIAENKVGRNGYLHIYPHYEEWYGSSLRTIKRWVAHGREIGVVCPLDDPEKLYAWLDQHLKKPVPAGVTQALIQWRKKKGSETAAPEVKDAEAEKIDSDQHREDELSRPVNPEEMGLEAALNRLEEMEVRLARLATQPGGAKPWLDTISRMTSVSTKLREEMEKLGKLIPKQLAESLLIELLQPVEQGVRGLYDTMCKETGVVPCSKSREKWERACDKIFTRFGKEIFGEVSS